MTQIVITANTKLLVQMTCMLRVACQILINVNGFNCLVTRMTMIRDPVPKDVFIGAQYNYEGLQVCYNYPTIYNNSLSYYT